MDVAKVKECEVGDQNGILIAAGPWPRLRLRVSDTIT